MPRGRRAPSQQGSRRPAPGANSWLSPMLDGRLNSPTVSKVGVRRPPCPLVEINPCGRGLTAFSACLLRLTLVRLTLVRLTLADKEGTKLTGGTVPTSLLHG